MLTYKNYKKVILMFIVDIIAAIWWHYEEAKIKDNFIYFNTYTNLFSEFN